MHYSRCHHIRDTMTLIANCNTSRCAIRIDVWKTWGAHNEKQAVRFPLAQCKEQYETDGSGVLCSPAKSYLARLAPCSQEEADTCLLLHAPYAVQKGCKKVSMRTVDTDVAVLTVALFNKTALMSSGLPLTSGQTFITELFMKWLSQWIQHSV